MDLNKRIKSFAIEVGKDISQLRERIAMIQPTDISRDIANILSNGKTISKIHQEQINFDNQQKLANLKISLEKGIYYIEDCLEEGIRQKVLNGFYRDNKPLEEESLKVVSALTKFFKDIPNGAFVTSRKGTVFPVRKYSGYKPEIFGADNRRIKKGGYVTLTVHGSQPCIFIENKDMLHIDLSGATFIAEDMGVSVFEVSNSNHWNIVHAGNITTRRFLEVGYIGGRTGLFPPIDGWSEEHPEEGTGYADKGYYHMGFNTADYTHDISSYRNNQAEVQDVGDLSEFIGESCSLENITKWHKDRSIKRSWGCGGYWTEDGIGHEFPQEDGSVSPKWGTWGGAQHGSHGNAWHFYGCNNFTINYFDVRGMNGSAIVMGLYGKIDGTSVNAGDSHIAEENGMVCHNFLITGGYIHGNYVGGVGIVRGTNIIVSRLFCPDGRVGHPDASVEHTRKDGGITIDPGYWIWTSRYLPQNNIRYEDNTLGLAARKVCDAHTGNNINIINNTGSSLYYACGLVIQEAYAAVGGGGDSNINVNEESSFGYQDSNINIIGNTFVSGNIGLHLNNGDFGVKKRKDRGLWWLRGNVRIHNNTIYANKGITYNYGHGGFDIQGNNIIFAMPFGEPFGMRGLNEIKVVSQGQNYSDQSYITVTGGGPKARGFYMSPVIKSGKVTGVNVDSGGTCVDDLDSVVISVVDPTGAGSGAVIKAGSITNWTFAYFFGADGKYGTITDAKFSNNRAKNSPDGNFMRMFWTGHMQGCTITDNRFDITPYDYATQSDPANKPYRSNREYVNKAGQRVQILNQAVNLVDCFVQNNKAYNLVTGQVDDIPFRESYTTTGTRPQCKLVTESELSSNYISKAELAEILKNINKDNPIIVDDDSGGKEETPPEEVKEEEVPPSNTDSLALSEGSIIEWKSFKGVQPLSDIPANIDSTMKWVKTRNFPDGWNSYVNEEQGITYLETHSERGRSDGAMLFADNINLKENAGDQITIVVPFKALDFNNGRILWIVGSYQGEWDSKTGVNPNANAYQTKIGSEFIDGKFSFTRTPVQINGVTTKASDQFDLNKWYVLSITGTWAGNGIMFGGPANRNGMHSMQIGEGVRVYRNGTPSKEHLDAYISELVQKYEKLNQASQ